MPSTGFFSHQELEHADPYRKQKFFDAAQDVDCAICMSQKYQKLIEERVPVKTVQIIPGVDLDLFSLRTEARALKDILVLGFVGQLYDTTARKNPGMLEKIAALPFVEMRATEGKIPAHQMPDFYKSLDLIVSPSTIEGGPMALLEGLATGVPSLCYEGVGFADEFAEGVIKCPFNDEACFLQKLKQLWQGEIHYYRDIHVIKKMRAQVVDFTWQNFALQHDQVWNELMN